MDEIDKIADRYIHAIYNDRGRCGYFAKRVAYVCAIDTYKLIYPKREIPAVYQRELDDESDAVNLMYKFSKEELYQYSPYVPSVPIDYTRYSASFDVLAEVGRIANNFKWLYRNFSELNEPAADRYPEYAFMFIVILEEYRRVHDTTD